MTRRRFPAIPGDLGRNTIARMKELLEIWSGDRGDQLDSVATLRDLVEANIARISRGGRMEAVAAGQDPVRVGPLSNLRVNGAFQNMIIEWGGISQPGYAYAEVWRGEADNLGDAVMIGASRGFVFTDPVGPGSSYYYWVRAVSTTGHPGPYNASAGTFGQTAPDVEYLLDKLEGEITETQFNQDLTSRLTKIEGNEGAIQEISEELTPLSAQWTVKQQVNDLVGGIGLYNDGQQTMFAVNANRFYITDDGTVPFVVDNGQTFIRDAVIQDASITTAKIQDAFLDNLTAAKGTLAQARIQKGDVFDLTVGNVIESDNYQPGVSGFRLNRDGFFETMDGQFRGDISASNIYGSIIVGGTIIATEQIRPTDAGDPYYTVFDSVYRSVNRDASAPDGALRNAPFIAWHPYNAGPTGVNASERTMSSWVTARFSGSGSGEFGLGLRVRIYLVTEGGSIKATLFDRSWGISEFDMGERSSITKSQNGISVRCSGAQGSPRTSTKRLRIEQISGSYSWSYNANTWGGSRPRFGIRMTQETNSDFYKPGISFSTGMWNHNLTQGP